MQIYPTLHLRLLTLALVGFFLIFRCTRRAHAILYLTETIELSLQSIMGATLNPDEPEAIPPGFRTRVRFRSSDSADGNGLGCACRKGAYIYFCQPIPCISLSVFVSVSTEVEDET